MAISEKTRKIIWGRSGNRCALCRRELVINATTADDESVVGDECHIISGKGQGPRYDANFSMELIDEQENLILLCRVHHKMVDDQHETYTANVLSKLKADHEKWVRETLSGEHQVPEVRIRRIKENIPPFLVRLNSGREIMDIVGESYGYLFDHEEPRSQAEAELISQFLQDIHDWGDLWREIEPGERVKATFGLSESLRDLETSGLALFGAREIRHIEGGVGPAGPWPIAILKVARTDSPGIINLPI